jgi:FkbM family methyltransferase
MRLFDIGANRGHYSDKLLYKCNEVVLVEPNLHLYNELVKKYHNHSTKIIVLNNIVSTVDTVFYECDIDTISTCDIDWIQTSRFANYRTKWTPRDVKAVTIDFMIEQYGVPDIIKIDVEGYEWNVIQTLSHKVPKIQFEWAEEKKSELHKIVDYLYTVLGYTQFFMKDTDTPYEYEPDDAIYYSYTDMKSKIDELDEIRKYKWGMVYVK